MLFLNVARTTVRPFQHAKTFHIVNLNVTRTYAKWVSRRPIAIVNEDELYECSDTTSTTIGTTKPQVRPRRRRTSIKKLKKIKEESSEKAESKENQTKKNSVTKLWENDKIVSSMMLKLKSRKKREETNEIILEGHRLITDALKAGATANAIIYNNPSDLDKLKLSEDIKLYKVPYNTIQLWSCLSTSPGLIGIFKTPDVHNNAASKTALPLTIICDNIREPGNLGSIMRVAAAVGCEKLILAKGCVDLWDPKVLRSAAGTHFQLPIHAFPSWEEISSLITEDCHVFLTDSNFGDQYLKKYSPGILEASLEIFNIDPEDLKSKLTHDSKSEETTELETPTNKKMMQQFMLKFPIVPYFSIDYTKKEIVIILSGETEGLSFDCYKFLKEQKCIRVNIPLAENVDSLNAGVALGIVIFEIKRQFCKRQSEL